ncbi:MAG: baseplate J/gp47 family protein [Spirochaetes bacterium]|nr:baseplate J/gp47 family protein [Spirochaetota bacterium]MBN2771281.1 baseplate J/gp47 family protein [Spirochaetota bacterium]
MKELLTEQELEKTLYGYIREDEQLKNILTINTRATGKFRAAINIIKRAIAEYVNVLIMTVFRNIFVTTADRDGLPSHLKDRGLEPWKPAKPSTGKIRIGSSSKPTQVYKIPQLTIVGTNASNGKKQYRLFSAVEINQLTVQDSSGYYTTEIDIVSVAAGASYNIPSMSIDTLYTDITGIDVVYNPEQTQYGRDEEDIEDVRNRCIVYDNIEKKYDSSWFLSETLNFDFVKDAAIVPRYQGRGTLGIAIITPTGAPTQEQLDIIYIHFNNDATDPAGIYNVIPFAMETYNWNATITLFYVSAPPAEADAIKELQSYFTQLSRGQRIVQNQVESRFISNLVNVQDVLIEDFSPLDTPIEAYPQVGVITWRYDVFTP